MHNTDAQERPTGSRLWLVGLTVVILAAGGALTAWIASQAEDRLHSDLNRQAILVAKALNPADIQKLSGTSADLETPLYHRLKHYFRSVMQLSPQYRFVYLMGQKSDGTIFFFADNEVPGSASESPAGMIYDDAPEVCYEVFRSGKGRVSEPYQDRWGEWVTAYVPVFDSTHKEMIAVLGLDFDAGMWNQTPLRSMLVPVFFASALLGIVLIGAFLLNWRSRVYGKPPVWMYFILPALVAVMGLAVTVAVAFMLYERGMTDRRAAFDQLAESRTSVIVDVLRDLGNVELEALGRFFEGSEAVEVGEFRYFADFLVRNSAVQGWAWAEPISAEERAAFEARNQDGRLPDFEIWQYNADGLRERASDRALYYPVTFLANRTGTGPVIGFDLMSESVRRTVLEETLQTGLRTASDPVILVDGSEPEMGILVLRPVFHVSEPDVPRGVVLAALRMKALLSQVDTSGSVHLKLLMLRDEEAAELLTASHNIPDHPGMELSFARPIFAFGKVFVLDAHAGAEFMRVQSIQAGWVTLLSGFLMTLLLTIGAFSVVRRAERLEELVQVRTREVEESRERFKHLFERAPLGYQSLDADGRFIEVNEAWLATLGYERDEVIGKWFGDFLARNIWRRSVRASRSSRRRGGFTPSLRCSIRMVLAAISPSMGGLDTVRMGVSRRHIVSFKT